ncbi:PREDICTED: uncharacterized protein LOC104799894 [Tarenaya hassleriana]|uniref:uncharacterized protein LOC104799894 n=1 Tax=Tarenaya hassleriana TaxID=28532 RepID=UPI00053C34C9|nr:PREDICTED: uncharacterized protein LOC104799894 [Tarenaya hassleriana]
MGGGRAITTAAKVAGIGVTRGGFTGGAGYSAVPPATEQLAVRNAPSTRHISAAIASATHQIADDDVAVVQKPVWDDWEFAGVEEELGGGGEPIARVVFSGPPTLQEAKDATEDLKEAIDMVYLSSQKTSPMEGPVAAGPVSGILRSVQSSENDVFKGVQSRVSPVPKVALQAFAFLSESPAAQSVVASIASDPKVWDAVMENKDLVEFLESNKTGAHLHDNESPKDDDQYESSVVSESEVTTEEKTKEPWGFLEDMKLKVVDLVHNVSAYFGGLFGLSSSSEESSDSSFDGKAESSFFPDGRIIFGLVVIVISVVVLKRA